jgi:CRISPR/Cas system-associated exonuclease Cas4 (RecB family)
VYNNLYQYKIPFDPRIRFELESTIHNMRNSIKTGKISLNHNDPRRCKSCSMREHCNNKIS